MLIKSFPLLGKCKDWGLKVKAVIMLLETTGSPSFTHSHDFPGSPHCCYSKKECVMYGLMPSLPQTSYFQALTPIPQNVT